MGLNENDEERGSKLQSPTSFVVALPNTIFK